MRIKNPLRICLFAGLLCVSVMGAGYVGYRGYRSVRQTRLVKQARIFVAKKDEKKALLTLQRLLRSNPRNVEGCRLMAQLAEATYSPAALMWRSRVVELNPRSLEDRLALAQIAMMMRDHHSATNALEGVDANGKRTAAYHNVAGAVAATANEPAQAEMHFLEAARLEPLNPVPRLNLAVVRLQQTNVQAQMEARVALDSFASNPTNAALRCQALRELTADALHQSRSNAALGYSRRVLQETNSLFKDRLTFLYVLQQARNPEFRSALAALQNENFDEPGNISEFAKWQMVNTSAGDALLWLQRLPSKFQTNAAVALSTAECLVAVQDWKALQDALSAQSWGDLEFLRHAYLTCALRGQNLAGAAKGEWEQALAPASSQKSKLGVLLRLAGQWKWSNEGEEILWTIVNRYPGEKWAVTALTRALMDGGRTRPLMMLYKQEVKRSPMDLSAKNNLAMTALLLDAQELKPHDLAREIYLKAPTNASFASTYAFSLLLQEKGAEAFKVIQQLKPGDLETPSIAGYYGLVLTASGEREKARAYLNWASKGQLLPEEKKLFERAKAGV